MKYFASAQHMNILDDKFNIDGEIDFSELF